MTEVLSVVSSGVRLLFSFLCSPAVIDFKRNEAVNNYFYPGNPPLPPNGSLAEAPPRSGKKKSPNPSHPDGPPAFKEQPPYRSAVGPLAVYLNSAINARAH